MGFDDMLEGVAEDIIELLIKTLFSGTVLLASTPPIALATIFNNRVGFVDPLLLPPRQTFRDYPYSMFDVIDSGVQTGRDKWPSNFTGIQTGTARWPSNTIGQVTTGTDPYA